MKVCTKCLAEKELDEYNKYKKSKDGLNYWCRACCNAEKKAYRESNKGSVSEANRVYYEKNRVHIRAKHKEWKENNPSLRASHKASYRASKLSASPSWLTEYHWHCIEAMYSIAKRLEELTQEVWHVDHIVPLQGRNVCGLHVPWNLRVVEASVNLTKSNKYEEWHV